MITYDRYLNSTGKVCKAFELMKMIIIGAYQSNSITFKNPTFSPQLMERFQYCQDRFALTFVSKNVQFANEKNPDVAYLFYRILQAQQNFYKQFLESIKSTHSLVTEALNDIPNLLKPVMDYFKQYIPNIEKYQENNSDAVDLYLTSAESEKNNRGYFNPTLNSFLMSMPKHRKYAFILGQISFALSDPAMYDKIYAPDTAQSKDARSNSANSFLDHYHSTMIKSLGLNEIKFPTQTVAEQKEETQTDEISTPALRK